MSAPLLVAATLAAAVWPNEARLSLVSAAAIVVEGLPFLLASAIAQRIAGARTALVAYAGCGCTAGASARSLAAAAFTWLTFGPLPAIARLAAASIVDRCLSRNRNPCAHDVPDLVNELERLLPLAFAAAIAAQLAARLNLAHAGLTLQIVAGAVMGFCAPPCAIGAIAVAAALRSHAAAASAAFLCVAGIVDLNAFRRTSPPSRGAGDAFAYAVLAAGAGIVAFRHGAELVRPAFAPIVGACGAAAVGLAIARRNDGVRRMHLAPAVVLLGALIAVPPPVYRATETTLAEIFPGERLSFTGVVSRDDRTAALVRYAITCCRADASPIVLRLARPTRAAQGTWARADGIVVATPSGFALYQERLMPAPPPADPFLYR